MENCDNSSFSVETEDLECDISHISTGMNIEYSDTLITVFFLVVFRWKTLPRSDRVGAEG